MENITKKKPDDYVIATGKQYSVRQFIGLVAKQLDISLSWVGKGINEKGIDIKTKKIIIEIDRKYFRPLDVNTLLGDSKKAKYNLNWKPKINIHSLIKEMIEFEQQND